MQRYLPGGFNEARHEQNNATRSISGSLCLMSESALEDGVKEPGKQYSLHFLCVHPLLEDARVSKMILRLVFPVRSLVMMPILIKMGSSLLKFLRRSSRELNDGICPLLMPP